MKVETITYKRICNLGNYESEHLEMTASLEEEDDPVEVAESLKILVTNQLLPVPEPTETLPTNDYSAF